MNNSRTKVILVGIGGATCSGKTTLAKHLKNILPNSVIIHQDDFAPPRELIPRHPVYDVEDWDTPQGAIDWSRFRTFLRAVKKEGSIPLDHRSHDHLNEQKEFPIDAEHFKQWKDEFEHISRRFKTEKHTQILWGLVDGFLLYWDKEAIDQLDARIFLRVPHDELKRRRHERHGYHTAEGALWRDPPHYWEQIVYPAYLEAHKDIFEGGNVETGKLNEEKVKDLMVLENAQMDTTDVVAVCCEKLKAFVSKSEVTANS
ncbi:hypothetical protein F5I97DRAFT_1852647 [Phlebopus sp. FC_14]|nr:hypothetical protein F5I97DRAFT_1852647 [Phlebopus sp. FC_14]